MLFTLLAEVGSDLRLVGIRDLHANVTEAMACKRTWLEEHRATPCIDACEPVRHRSDMLPRLFDIRPTVSPQNIGLMFEFAREISSCPCEAA